MFPSATPLEGEKTMVLEESKSMLPVDSLPYRFLSLETNDNSLIKDINRLYCYKDTLFVFDRYMKKIIVFNNETGEYLNDLSYVGSGPGEYVQVTDFCIDSKRRRIIITCDIPYKLIFYSFSGEFLNELSLRTYYSEIVFAGDSLFGLVDDGDGHYIDVLDYNGDQINKVDIPDRKMKFETTGIKHKFAKGCRLSVYENEIYFTCPYDNSIYTIRNGELYKKYDLDFGEQTLPKEMLVKNVISKEFSRQCRKNNWVCTILEIVQSKDKLFFHTNSGFFLCNKADCSMTNYRVLSLPDIGGTSLIQALNGANEIVEVLPASQLMKKVNTYLKYQESIVDINPVLWKVYQSINDESNPILVICKL